MKINKQIQISSVMQVKGMDEDDDSIIVEGYANTTTKDRVGDIVLEEAWMKGGLDNYLKNPIILAYHKYDDPIGKMVEYSVNNQGLHIVAKISKAAGKVYDLVKDGVLKTFSIGFMVKDADYDTTTDIFVIKDLELHEISVVSVPANADSTFSVRKSFEDDKAYNEYKDSLIKVEDHSTIKGDPIVDPKTKKDDVIELTPEQLEAKLAAAVTKAFEKAKAKADANEAAAALALEAGKTGAESLIKDFEARMEAKDATVTEALEGMRTELKEKSDELAAIRASKMTFSDPKKDVRKLSNLEIDTAVLVAKTLNKSVSETEYFSGLKTKLGDHLADMTDDSYETIYSTRMYDAVQDKLIIEPLFNASKIAMNARSMVFPFNPQAGYASWVSDTKYKSALNPSDEATVASGVDISGNLSSTGPARNHAISDISIKAEKLASKEAIGYEEDEDSIIPIVPIITAAISKRMARSTDIELLRGDVGVATHADIGVGLINGVSTIAVDQGTTYTQDGSFGTANPVTIADLQQTRRKMGSWGLNPMDVIYVVNESVYWDLLEDPDFRTMDLVGSNATILRGQVGAVNGSPVVVSDSFAAPAIDARAAVALNVNNYLFGELRGLSTERDKDILNQKNWIITTRRFAFKDIDNASTSCATLLYPAA